MAEDIKRGRGRPPGAKNRRTEEREHQLAVMAEKLQDVIEDCFQGDAHALLMATYKDMKLDLAQRIDAAKAAIRYEKPALSTVDAIVDARVEAVAAVEWRVVDSPAVSA